MTPVRIVHLGLGGFFRAHQAWYTGAAPDAAAWGIAAFTGRSRALADELTRQDGRYTLVVRGPERDEMFVQRAVSEALPGADFAAWCERLARPQVAVVTLTVTEAGYRRDRDGGLDFDDPDVRADIAAIRAGSAHGSVRGVARVTAPGVGPGVEPGVEPGVGPGAGPGAGQGVVPGVGPGVVPGVGAGAGQGVVPRVGPGVGPGAGPGAGPGVGQGVGPGVGPGVGQGVGPVTVPGRLVAGLAARRAAGAGAIAVVSCDNLPGNGAATARVVTDLAEAAEPALAHWIREHVSFVTTMVDRITPRTTAQDVRAVAEQTGWQDAVPVVTEPFTEWVLSGAFPAGRPEWEAAGARFVADVHPHETRKLLLLNGGHSLLAYAGSARGHETVAGAIADPVCRGWLDQWWDEAVWHVPLPAAELAAYRAALAERFANPRIRHTLAQIAADGSQKIPIRVLPVLRAERAAGRMPAGAVRIVAAWILHLRGSGAPVSDAGAGPYLDRVRSVRDVLALLAPDLAGDADLIAAIDKAVA